MKDFTLEHHIGKHALDYSDFMDLFTLHNGGTPEQREAARKKQEESMEEIHKYVQQNYRRI